MTNKILIDRKKLENAIAALKNSDARYINVSADCIGLAPVPLDDLLHNVVGQGREPQRGEASHAP